ncbi:cytochrome c-type biogenesis protein [Cerasibacillus quisquiliarum]|uniref:Cytochrome C biogenesis protein CcdA n=1 Tax=Cerasibacillus quisquiliarum TaxID=227865 RepID=A0A511V0X8_9BACI|nr:cytochrome c biogenesis protein CcdA [Cerasibacillus quisquiliarum]MBB5146684.1 cytochrome c-type biogenesis protein [Cerasibacillus quisquiliarum]GEN31383.1 cytochrome C biogenesis protein CcdA [Cerasibacillus quisquiliarum]
MTTAADLTIWLAFGAGALSFLSPCTLPLFPAYLSYITGMSVKELEGKKEMKVRSKLMLHSIFFLIGVSSVFISLGVGISFLGSWLQDLFIGDSGKLIQRLAGIFIIVMGLFVAGWISIKPFMNEKRFQFTKKPVGYLGTLFVGMGFAAGWTPCIGPIFASILVVAAANPTQGTVYTLAYVLGFALPFLILAFFIGSTRWIVKYSEKIMKVGGGLMVVMGLLLFTGQMTQISTFLLKFVEDTWLMNLG